MYFELVLLIKVYQVLLDSFDCGVILVIVRPHCIGPKHVLAPHRIYFESYKLAYMHYA